MRQFYISDPAVFDLEMSAFDFRLYSYLCKNYDLKRLAPFVRMIDCADHFVVPMPKIKEALQRLSLMNIDYKPLITHKKFTYFDMPRYKHFLENIKFKKDYSNKGFNKVKQNVYTYRNGNYDY
jgi:hypothetical protein|tara:strand:+ start:320 stop:688 length:369 start_codon:yes stop_codon:yes gene_type:complete